MFDMLPLIVANGEVPGEYLTAGLQTLAAGGGVLDAVEEVARLVELDTNEDSVGVGGLPNVLGDVELDAMIMDGGTRRVGAVAGVRKFANPISIARAVMTRLPHVMLVGAGADRFARECGFAEATLLTSDSRAQHRALLEKLGAQDLGDEADAALAPVVNEALKRRAEGDTMNALACDADGHMAVAVSTSGLGWKYPGRAGDSPVPGAGGYADDRYGAAAATGMGELVLRSGTTLRAVLYHETGMTPHDAARRALGEVCALPGYDAASVRLIYVTPSGEVCGFATYPGAQVKLLRAGDSAPTALDCELVTPPQHHAQ